MRVKKVAPREAKKKKNRQKIILNLSTDEEVEVVLHAICQSNFVAILAAARSEPKVSHNPLKHREPIKRILKRKVEKEKKLLIHRRYCAWGVGRKRP